MTTPADQPMTNTELMKLVRILKLRTGVAKGDIDAVAAARKAHVEDQLAREFSAADERWKRIIADAQRHVDEAHEQIDKMMEAAGVPQQFRPRLHLGWSTRGENGDPQRRAELRKVAYTRIEADAQAAKASILRAQAENEADLLSGGITSAEGNARLAALPTPEQLIPSVSLRELESARIELHNHLTNQSYAARHELEGYYDKLGYAGGVKPDRDSPYELL